MQRTSPRHLTALLHEETGLHPYSSVTPTCTELEDTCYILCSDLVLKIDSGQNARPALKTIKKNTNSTQNESETHHAKQYEVTSFLSTDCELSTVTCSKNVYAPGPLLENIAVGSVVLLTKPISFFGNSFFIRSIHSLVVFCQHILILTNNHALYMGSLSSIRIRRK